MASQRLAEKVRRDFSTKEADLVLELLDQLGDGEADLDKVGQERVQGAVVLLAAGNSQKLLSALTLARADWRDVLVAAGLAHDDWPVRLTQWLRR